MKTIMFGGKTYTCPFYDIMPPLTEEERAELHDDIAANGMTLPVVVTDADEVIDGHNRLEIAAELGLKVWKVPFTTLVGLTADQKRARALDLNLHRRHLTREQKRDIVVRLLKSNPERSNREIAAEVHLDHKTVATARATAEATGEIPQLATTKGRDGKVRPARRAKVVTETVAAPTVTNPEPEPEPAEPSVSHPVEGDAEEAIVAAEPEPAEPENEEDEPADPENLRTAFILRADVALEFAEKEYTGPITPDMIDLARRAASAWYDLATTLGSALSPQRSASPPTVPAGLSADGGRDEALRRADEALGALQQIDRHNPGRRDALLHVLDRIAFDVGGVTPSAVPRAAEVRESAKRWRRLMKNRSGRRPRDGEVLVNRDEVVSLLDVLIDLLKRLV